MPENAARSHPFLRRFDLFRPRGIHLLIGGYAVRYYGHPRYTADMDIWIEATPENAAGMVAVLEEFGFGQEDLTQETLLTPGIIVRMGRAPLRLEILNQLDDRRRSLAHSERLCRAVPAELGFLTPSRQRPAWPQPRHASTHYSHILILASSSLGSFCASTSSTSGTLLRVLKWGADDHLVLERSARSVKSSKCIVARAFGDTEKHSSLLAEVFWTTTDAPRKRSAAKRPSQFFFFCFSS